MTLTRREKIMIVAGLIVVTVAAYVFYFIVPYMQKTQDAMMRYVQADAKVKVLKLQSGQAALMDDQIAALEGQLDSQGKALPKGSDHAAILLYLKELTDGKAETLDIEIPSQSAVEGSFVVQPVTLDFRATYDEYVRILAGLKENELYSRVTFVQAAYAPVEAQGAGQTETPTAGEAPADAAETARPAQPIDDDVLKVHMELNFYARKPAEGEQNAPPMLPTNGDRGTPLFPEK